MPVEIKSCPQAGLKIIKPHVFPDDRGFFFESYKESEYAAAGIGERFVQDNHSLSCSGVLRGLHFQREPYAQGKLVRVIAGSVWDVAVDIRPESPTYLKWYGLVLSAENRIQFYIPPGFAHGFLTLEDGTEFLYKCTAEYNKASEGGYRWDDPRIGIKWPQLGMEPLVSEKDALLPFIETLVATGV